METTTDTSVTMNEGGVDVDVYDDMRGKGDTMIWIIDDDSNIVISGEEGIIIITYAMVDYQPFAMSITVLIARALVLNYASEAYQAGNNYQLNWAREDVPVDGEAPWVGRR